jgi:hypothetical protein
MRGRLGTGAVVAALLMVLVPSGPAFAHDGPVKLDVAGDGAGGVTARAVFQQDGHPVEDGVRLVLTATGEGGRQVGPVQLAPAPEGRGFYTSGAVLSPGTWTVTVIAPQPHPGKATARVSARVPQRPPPTAVTAPARSDPSGRYGWLRWLLGVLLVVFALAAAVGRTRAGRTTRSR